MRTAGINIKELLFTKNRSNRTEIPGQQKLLILRIPENHLWNHHMEYEDKETMVLGILSELYNMQNLKDKRWEGAEDRHPEKTGCTEPH